MSTSRTPSGVFASVASKCAEVTTRFPLITHVYGYNTVPDHNNKRCIDFMVYNSEKPASWNLTRAQQVELGDAIAAYLWANRLRLGLVWLIWNRRALRTYGKTVGGRYYPPGTWSPYTGESPHTDHVHGEFSSAAYVPPSVTIPPPPVVAWSGKAEDFPGAGAFVLGRQHDAVIMLDRRLIAWGFTASNDGDGYQAGPTFTEHTRLNVQAAQLAFGFVGTQLGGGADGYPGPETWRRLMADPPPAPKPPAEKPTTQEEPPVDSTFTVAFGNALRRTDTVAGRLKWALRVGNIAKAFLSVNPDVIMACELDKTSAASLGAKLGKGWTWWRCGTGYGPVAVYWRTGGRFERRTGAQNETNLGENRWLLSLPLVHTATGEVVTFDVSHLENDGDPTTDGHKARYGEATKLAARTKTGRRIFGADLNSTTRSTAKATARQRQKPRPILRAAGWAGFLTESVPITLKTHHGGKGSAPAGTGADAIDELAWRGRLSLVTGGLINTAKTKASDHHFLWGRFKITK